MDVHLGRLTCIFLFLFFGYASTTVASVPEYNLLNVCNKTITMPAGRSVVVRWDPQYNCTECTVTVQPITEQGYIVMTMHPSTVYHSNMDVEPVDYSSSTSSSVFYTSHYHVFSDKIATFRASCDALQLLTANYFEPEAFTLTLTEIHRDGRFVGDCPGTSELYYHCGYAYNYYMGGYCIPLVTRCNGVKDCIQHFVALTDDESSCGEKPSIPSNNKPPTYTTDDDIDTSSESFLPYLLAAVLLALLAVASCWYRHYLKARKASENQQQQHIESQPRWPRPQPQSTIDNNMSPTSTAIFSTDSSRIPPTAPAPPAPPAPPEYTTAAPPPSYSDLFDKNPP